MQGFDEEAFSGLGVSCRTEQELEGVALRIDGSGEIGPGFFDFDVRFIHAPGVIGGFEVWPASFVELWSIALDESGEIGGKRVNLTVTFPTALSRMK